MERKCPVQKLREAVRTRNRVQDRRKEDKIEEQSAELRKKLSERKEKEMRRRATLEAGNLRSGNEDKVQEQSKTKNKLRMESRRGNGGEKTGGGESVEGKDLALAPEKQGGGVAEVSTKECVESVEGKDLGLAPEQQGGGVAEVRECVESVEGKELVDSAGDSDRAKQSPSLQPGHLDLAPEQQQGGEVGGSAHEQMEPLFPSPKVRVIFY